MTSRSRTARYVVVALVSLTMVFSMCIGGGLGTGDTAPDVSVKDVDGITHDLASYEGKVLIIDFFATWCVYCTDQLPTMEEVRAKYPEDKVAILMVDNDDRESREKVADYRVRYDITWPVAYGGGDMGQDYQVEAIPTTVVIDGDGVVQYYHTGTVSASKLIKTIDELV